MITIDGFLDDFGALRDHCDTQSFAGAVNPLDGVLYPGISVAIPENVQGEIREKLRDICGGEIVDMTIFMRLSPLGVEAPHQAHTDLLMGTHGLMLYLNREEHCQGGTAFVEHIETGMTHNPACLEEERIWRRDTNDYYAWREVDRARMIPNRALLFDTARMHRAEPVEGFGERAEDARLVLVCFFGVKRDS